MATKSTNQVLLGYAKLTDAERAEFDREAQNFRLAVASKQFDLREGFRANIQKMDTGGVGTGCACCGR